MYYIGPLHELHDSVKSSPKTITGNGQKRELTVLFGQKRMYPENNSGIECCWPYLIGQHPLSSVFGQKRPGTPGNSYFAQLPPVFGHFMFLSGGLLDYSNGPTWATRIKHDKRRMRPQQECFVRSVVLDAHDLG